MKTHFITGGGDINLHVVETGNPAGNPILFIHGFSQSYLSWQKQLHSSLADEFRLIAFDIRGHGLSEKPRNMYDESRLWAEDIHAIMTTLSLEKPVLVGWSYGGLIISDYVSVYGDRNVGAINFVGALSKLGSKDIPSLIGADFLNLLPGFFSDDVETCAEALKTFMRLMVHHEMTMEDFYFTLGFNAVVPPHVRERLFARSVIHDKTLARMQKPMILTHGEQDKIVLPEAARQHASLVKQAQISWYPEVGHAPFWEDSERFNHELQFFARSV
jgi:pimeloyl-ACP methyl ester carboxylesterase